MATEVTLPDVTVVVTTEVAVVDAVQPDQVVHGALVLHEFAVQPDQVESGHAEVPSWMMVSTSLMPRLRFSLLYSPHHFVQAPDVHGPEDSDAHGPQPFCAPPNGPPIPGPHPAEELFHAPPHAPPAKLEAADERPVGRGWADVKDDHSEAAVGLSDQWAG